jgi:SNF2 family DNA or RNA helicase
LQEASALRKIEWCVLVVDEAHRMKNEKSKLATLLRQV